MERFAAIEQEVKTVSNKETLIRNAMEEQATGSQHILEAITRLNTISGEVQRSSSEMAQTTREALKQSSNLKRISSEVGGGMDEITQNAEMITSSVGRVQGISQQNYQNIDALSGEIARFKLN